MSQVTTFAIDDWLTAQWSWTAGTIKVAAITTSYVFSTAHDNWDDVPGGDVIGEITIPGRTVSGGVCAGDGLPLTIPSAAGLSLGGLWIYRDTGTDSTSRLIAWIDDNADGTPISGTTTVDGIVVPWNTITGIIQVAALPT